MEQQQQASYEGAVIAPQPGMQNVLIYSSVNGFMIILQLLGGWFGFPFFGNIFLGCTVLLGIICLAMTTMETNITYAKTHRIGWWMLFPLVIGFISLGFGWYFTWVIFWAMFTSMSIKKILGDDELKQQEMRENTVPMPPSSFPDEEDIL